MRLAESHVEEAALAWLEELGYQPVSGFDIGERVGVPWLGHSCQTCGPCLSGHENLCDAPEFTGYTRDGGFATHMLSEAAFTLKLDGKADPVAARLGAEDAGRWRPADVRLGALLRLCARTGAAPGRHRLPPDRRGRHL